MNTYTPLISIIVTTRNNEVTLAACLRSIVTQSYPHRELIVVDNNSTDATKAIARRFGARVFNRGPERSAQRNFGADKAKGEYVLIIDSDMELSDHVVRACVQKIQAQPKAKALIIPEESFGEGFWAHCKQLERSFYVGQDAIEAARFFSLHTYQANHGYNQGLTGGEDWDLTRRVRGHAEVARIDEYIFHNEGRPRFTHTARKMYYYARHAAAYFAANPGETPLTSQAGPLARYKLFFSQPGKLLKNPLVGAGMLLLKTTEYGAGALGFLRANRDRREEEA